MKQRKEITHKDKNPGQHSILMKPLSAKIRLVNQPGLF
jgi:hypothetical protein